MHSLWQTDCILSTITHMDSMRYATVVCISKDNTAVLFRVDMLPNVIGVK